MTSSDRDDERIGRIGSFGEWEVLKDEKFTRFERTAC
jgi:hypothetical protein